jgi:hypothetical protein
VFAIRAFLKKEQKNFYPLFFGAERGEAHRLCRFANFIGDVSQRKTDKSLFVSFSSEKEDLASRLAGTNAPGYDKPDIDNPSRKTSWPKGRQFGQRGSCGGGLCSMSCRRGAC